MRPAEEVVTSRGAGAEAAADPFAAAGKQLFPPLRNRTLSEAAGALAKGDVAIAETLVEKFLARKPSDPDALNLLADIARRSRRFEEAEQLIARCVKQRPESAGHRYNYVVILRLLHRHEAALVELDELLRRDPQNPLFREQKATLLTSMGRHAEALGWRRDLAEEFPECPIAWLRYGHTLRDVGLQELCVSAFHKALELSPYLATAYAGLADLKVYRFTAAEMASMEECLRCSGLSSDQRADFHHALGNAYEKERQFAKSFENYTKANALRRIGVDFDPEKLVAHRTACETLFTEEFFRERADWGSSSNAPIFIVGIFRSGSTLLEQILSSHSAIEGLGELNDLDTALVRPLARFKDEVRLADISNGNVVDKTGLVHAYALTLDRLDAMSFRAIGEEYLELMGRRITSGRPFFTDKTLRNFLNIGLIRLMFPNAKIIDARRHPLDCGWSCFKSQFPGAHFARRLSDIGLDYSNYVRLMAHFDKVLPGKIHRVIYENLIADPLSELQKLFNYLDLPFEEGCLRFYENKRSVTTQSSQQVRKPLYTNATAQWVPYEPWLGPLKSALGPVLDNYPDAPP